MQGGAGGERPRLLSPDDGVRLYYHIKDNSYSEGNKMRVWEVSKDVNGDGTMGSPGDNMANYVWKHLFIYSDLEGAIPKTPEKSARKHIGMEIPVNTDSGPSGKNVSGGYMSYSGGRGGNIVFTDSLVPGLRDVPLTLTASYSWDALGLPLTAFNDSRRKGSIRTVTDYDFQHYQYAFVQLRDRDGRPLTADGKEIGFFGTEPVDISNCLLCHSGKGKAASLSRKEGLLSLDKEYEYWRKNYTDASDYYSRLASATIGILELHDSHHGTTFLKNYDPSASSNRLGSTGSVNCTDCHIAPFVESGGGRYFPIDQPGKYSLYRYSKAHGAISCQSCHESVHGLYPVRYEGPQKSVDLTSHEQALQFSPDGEYAGPVTCGNCHTVNKTGIPVQLKGTEYYSDYWSSVVLIHFMRDGDQKLPLPDLLGKYPYAKAREVSLKNGL